MKLLLQVLLFLSPFILAAQDITGDWSGILNAPNAKLSLIFHFTKTTNGYTSTMDSPDQNAKGIPVSQVSFVNPKLNLSLSSAGIQYEGILGDDEKIRGDFKQGGLTIPLELTKGTVVKPKPVRPQEPAKPYPYYSEDIQFPNSGAGVSLAGTLTLPARTGVYPAVILISGSGPQNRDEELFDHKPFLVLADHLTKNGIAVLRFDDRGTYKSTGDFRTATTSDLASDVESALAYLLSRTEINKKKIGLIGHSEGGVIAPIVASKHPEVSFIVLLAGTGIAGGKILSAQSELIAKASGMPEATLSASMKIHRDLMGIVVASKDSVSLSQSLSEYFHKALKENPAFQKPASVTDEDFIRPQISQLTNRWMMNFIKYDPAPVLEKVRCPVLALNGSKDLQVPSAENLAAIRQSLEKGGNKFVTAKELPGLNHLFQESATGLPNEYGSIEQTFSPVALDEISTWTLKQVGGKRK